MVIPQTLKIGGHVWQVVFKKMDDKLGDTDWNTATITIDDSLPQSMKESAFIHEIMHCCNSTLGDTDFGHSLLDSLAEQIYQVMSDNNLLK